ncbi:CCA tRNA nucleotidyltransferase [Prochlorococcus sp. MIT 1300]|uniref:CCA tRNA nucleotidyltransferase n=1 Tax=Prochlorococcus sp. MIT 1300 TaxID=3096218 RepID=UPI002A765CB3|nr:CCA tRNA nucleotidyltransferase [Prochlorococcus sp. MIT 1300]
MPSPIAPQSILTANRIELSKIAWRRLKPDRWPFPFEKLPKGSVLVGGSVRDALLDRLPEKPDLDLVVPEHAAQWAQNFAKDVGGSYVLLDAARDIARIVLQGWTIDVAAQEGENLLDDLFRRDYRLNAVGLRFLQSLELVDPTGGIDDIYHKRICAISEKNLVADPLRLLRGFRLMAEMNFSLDPQTQKWVSANSKLLPQVAPERIRRELELLLSAPFADDVLPLVKEMHLFRSWDAGRSSQEFSLKDASLLSENERAAFIPLVRLANLLSNEGLKTLRFSTKISQRCGLLCKWRELNDGKAFESLSEEDRLQLHIDLEPDLPALILDLPDSEKENWLERWRDQKDPLFHPSSPLDGNTLQQTLGIAPGRELGKLMRYLRHERAFGRLNTRDEAIHLARKWCEHNWT